MLPSTLIPELTKYSETSRSMAQSVNEAQSQLLRVPQLIREQVMVSTLEACDSTMTYTN
jgi:hypothetical protein